RSIRLSRARGRSTTSCSGSKPSRARRRGEWIVTMPIGEPPEYRDVPNNLRERRFPTRWELDRVSPRHPVYVRSLWGYWRHTLPLVSIANSEALRRAGITAETLP